MKRFLSLFVLFMIFALFPASGEKEASAAESGTQYAVAASRDVWFYSEANSDKGLFILPYTYYVRVVADATPFCRVEYHENAAGYRTLTGYCLKDDLLFVDYVPERPYLYYSLALSYSIENGSSIGAGSFDTIERTVSFYGTYSSGTATYFYVFADGMFDYVPATQNIQYDLNTDYLSAVSAGTEPTPGDTESTVGDGALSGIQIAVICIICAAAVIVAFFVLRGKKPPLPEADKSEF